jgi:prephenate dehydrogenase
MAWRSHLPHLVSSTLALALRDAGVRRSALGPGGRDMTRLAGGAPTMWYPIVRDNAAAIADALGAYEARLHALRIALMEGDAGAARRFIESAADWFDGEPERVLTRPRA